MIRIRRAADRGSTYLGWLDSRHSFSFGQYLDPENMGFGSLRVINDDRVAPGGGFGTHPHRDMEIVTCVLEGALEHRDSMGNSSVIRAGEVQRMSAGTGITHSEFNHSDREPVQFLQIWIQPEREGLEPSYEQRSFPPGQSRLLASRDGREGSLVVHQDVDLHALALPAGREVTHALRPGRKAWVHVVSGRFEAAGEELEMGDGLAVEGESELTLRGSEETEVLLFDMAG